MEVDRGTKFAIYAEAGSAENWIVNLVAEQVEVYRSPSGRAYHHRGDAVIHPRLARRGAQAVAFDWTVTTAPASPRRLLPSRGRAARFCGALPLISVRRACLISAAQEDIQSPSAADRQGSRRATS
jgi:Putative restriction endonuclease